MEKKKISREQLAKIIILGIVGLLVLTIIILSVCGEKPSQFTEEEHIARISKKIDKKIKKKFSKPWRTFDYDSFEVYPLYNQNEELEYFLVEFEPSYFIFIYMRDDYKYIDFIFGIKSMYRHSTGPYLSWSKYKIDPTHENLPWDKNVIWETDENGEKIVYNKSPYYVAGVKSEKRYLFEDGNGGYIPAIKKDRDFINLVSMTEVNFSDGKAEKGQPSIGVSFVGKPQFSL